MKIQPIASPAAIPPQGTPEHVRTSRAIEAFNKGASSYDKQTQPVQSPVRSQNNVSPEELSAIQPRQEQTPSPLENLEPQEQTPEPEQPEPVSQQLVMLARREKALRAKAQQQDQQLKSEREAMQAEKAELQRQLDTYKSGYVPRDQIKSQPLKTLLDSGATYEDLTNQILAQQNMDPYTSQMFNDLKQQIAELKTANETVSKGYQDQQDGAYKAAIKQIESDASKLIQRDPAFETIKATGRTGAVVKLIEDVYASEGVVLSVEEAAQQVEDELVTRYEKVARIDKIQKRIQQGQAKSSGNSAQQKQSGSNQQSQPMKTLTNASASTRQLSARERAILAAEGKL